MSAAGLITTFDDLGSTLSIFDTSTNQFVYRYVDVGRDKAGDHVYLVDDQGEQHRNVTGQVGFPFFGQLVLDCLHRTERAMTQEHAFKAAELCLRAQLAARRIT